MAILDEVARRKPGFREGVPVTFSDGSRLSVPKPYVRVVPVDDGNGGLTAAAVGTYGDPEVDARVRAVGTDGSHSATIGRLFDLARAVLARNYDLTGSDLEGLLAFDMDDEGGGEFLKLVYQVATGEVVAPVDFETVPAVPESSAISSAEPVAAVA